MSENIKVEVQRDESSPWIRTAHMAGPKLAFSFFFIVILIYIIRMEVITKNTFAGGFLYNFMFDIIFFGLPVFLLEILSKEIENYNVGVPSLLVGLSILSIFIYFIYSIGAFSPRFWSFYSNGVITLFIFTLFYLWGMKKAFERPFVLGNLLRNEKYYDFYMASADVGEYGDMQEFLVFKRGTKFGVVAPHIGLRAEADSIQAGIEQVKQQYIKFIQDYMAGKHYAKELYDGNDLYDDEDPAEEQTQEPPQQKTKHNKKEPDYSCYA